MNKLADETSPYLRQHAADPVDWHVWGADAFSASRDSGKPIFLSVGYASCHWCHVMHRESFADEATAEVLNRDFISVKVDRESRPDVDEVYMAYLVASSGRGGWPMSIFLTPTLVPVFGGSYFSPHAVGGMPSFPDVLDRMHTAFEQDSGELAMTAEQSADYLSAVFAPPAPGRLDHSVISGAVTSIMSAADPVHGGFGRGTKFPQAPVIDLLLEHHISTGETEPLRVARQAVSEMLAGGIYDQAGGGIARYSVDREWLVPHFEKMLYDNAQLLTTLAKLYSIAPDEAWRRAMLQTAEFLQRDLGLESGLLASSLDADTGGVEGATYIWTYDELKEVLDPGELEVAERHLGVTPDGNWEGTNILTRREQGDEGVESAERNRVDGVLGKILRARAPRPQPGLDDKAIVAWNALAVRGLLNAGRALGDDTLIRQSGAVLEALLGNAVVGDGDVVRLVGEADTGAFVLEDAAGLVMATLETAEADDDDSLLEPTLAMYSRAVERFYDGNGTWFMTGPDTELPVRPREQHDGPSPSGASLAALASIRLGRATARDGMVEITRESLARMATAAEASPFSTGTALSAMNELLTEQDC